MEADGDSNYNVDHLAVGVVSHCKCKNHSSSAGPLPVALCCVWRTGGRYNAFRRWVAKPWDWHLRAILRASARPT